ncbi:DgyrCDS8008 [Dimorphilus gyrociliatus]|uniref:DgyrCDS8008 n=1 Tax=Dimorphilus gyrociliatus TaxID=2664684 RepID=A0A7I8VVB4_9ANNE|nr:DgyrCDS8008 [Dimorphilus gyrociliatus]
MIDEKREELYTQRLKEPLSWLDFLFDHKLLEEHLKQPNPIPSAFDLIRDFLYQADLVTKDRDGRNSPSLPGRENRKAKALKILALKTSAFLKWDAGLLNKKLPVAVVYKVLMELLQVASGNIISNPFNQREFSNQPPYVNFAVILYHVWAVRYIIKESFITKPNRAPSLQLPGLIDTTTAFLVLREEVFNAIKDGLEQSVEILESALKHNSIVTMPTVECLQMFTEDIGMVAHDWTLGEEIACEEMHCQISYDLGSFYFLHQQCDKAFQCFTQCTSLLKKLHKKSFLSINEKKLAGYMFALEYICCKRVSDETFGLTVQQCKSNNFHGLISNLMEDNRTHQLSISERLSIELDVKYSEKSQLDAENIYEDVIACNMIRLSQEKILLPHHYLDMMQNNSTFLSSFFKFMEDILSESTIRGLEGIKSLIKYLCRHVENKQDIQDKLKGNKTVLKHFNEEEKQCLFEKQIPIDWKKIENERTIDIRNNCDTAKLEQLLLSNNDANTIKELVSVLLKAIGRSKLIHLTDKFWLPSNQHRIVENVKDGEKLVAQIYMAKSRIAFHLKLYDCARKLKMDVASMISAQLHKRLDRVLKGDMQLINLLQYEAFETLPPKGQTIVVLLTWSRSTLNSLVGMPPDTPDKPPVEVIEACVMLLINRSDWQVLCQLKTNSPVVEFARYIAEFCNQLLINNPQSSRHAARELFDQIILIFTRSPNPKRPTGMCESLGLLSQQGYKEFVSRLREEQVISILVSSITKLYSHLKNEITTEVRSEHESWLPSALGSSTNICHEAVQEAVYATFERAFKIDPNHPEWLRTYGDLCLGN